MKSLLYSPIMTGLIVALTLLSVMPLQAATPVTFQDCQLIDGSGIRARPGDVRVVDGRIAAIGQGLAVKGDLIIDCAGDVLAPGFIDLHNHSADGVFTSPSLPSQVSQGITTLVIGPDGGSPYPLDDYAIELEEVGVAVNVALFVGHGTVRLLVMGSDYKRAATAAEIAAMVRLVNEALDDGAFGLSSGLEYDPGHYSTTEELIALAQPVADRGGIYMTHMRDEEEEIYSALEEALRIGRETGIRVQLSHLKLGNPAVSGRSAEILDIIHRARRASVDVMADAYPYDAWASTARVLVPSRRFEEPEEVEAGIRRVGGADRILITSYPPDPTLEFRTLAESARARDTTPRELLIEIYRNGSASVVVRSMSDEDVHAFFRDSLVMVASDGGSDSRHPRKTGTFPRVLGPYVRDLQLFPLETAVAKMTSLPAGRLGLTDRGLIEVGRRADLVLFSPANVQDRSTFERPDLLAVGVRLTMVNGSIVWKDSSVTGLLPGEVLRATRR